MKESFHITIGSYPPDRFYLKNELNLIKVSLLYADKVRLCNLAFSFIISLLNLTSLNEDQKISLMVKLSSELHFSQKDLLMFKIGFERYRELRRKKIRNKEELLFFIQIKNVLIEAWEKFKEVIEQIAKDSGVNKLIPALESGLLEIKIYGKGQEMDFNINDFINEFFGSLGEALISKKTYPLFDDQTGKLVNAGIKEGLFQFPDSSSNKAKHVGFVSNIIQRLPTFDRAKIDEILDIRKSLEKPLIRFRSVIFKLSEEIAHQPWDENFYYDSEKLFYREIVHSVEEIEEECKSNKYLSRLLSQATDNSIALPAANSILGMMIAKLSDFTNISTIFLGLAAGTGTIAIKAFKEWKEKTKEIERNQIYFYYKAGEMLKNNS
ncbi:MAG: hypothetical protein KAX30_08100 [Candidatus Atribacteria bacterium]|nr:hypothetical protein [Candidatus Atribacteria bacterium]